MSPRKRKNSSTTKGTPQCGITTLPPTHNRESIIECGIITLDKHSSRVLAGFPQDGWSVYLIYSPSRKRTYVGSTTDVFRRLRQHRGEIRGGARSTSVASDWVLQSYITGFRGRSPACRWEKIVKGRSRGLKDRDLAMVFVGVLRLCPTKGRRKQKEYEVPIGLHYIDVQVGEIYEPT